MRPLALHAGNWYDFRYHGLELIMRVRTLNSIFNQLDRKDVSWGPWQEQIGNHHALDSIGPFASVNTQLKTSACLLQLPWADFASPIGSLVYFPCSESPSWSVVVHLIHTTLNLETNGDLKILKEFPAQGMAGVSDGKSPAVRILPLHLEGASSLQGASTCSTFPSVSSSQRPRKKGRFS